MTKYNKKVHFLCSSGNCTCCEVKNNHRPHVNTEHPASPNSESSDGPPRYQSAIPQPPVYPGGPFMSAHPPMYTQPLYYSASAAIPMPTSGHYHNPWMMPNADYSYQQQQAAMQPDQGGQSFQPQVGNTALGPTTQTYVPRHDVAMPGAFAHTAPGIIYPAAAPYFSQPSMGYPGMHVNNGMEAPSIGPQNMTPTTDRRGIYNNVYLGKTGLEATIDQARSAYQQGIMAPQDIKPADDDPERFYPFRQLNGSWIQVDRATIDHLPSRWFLTPGGAFYAVRLED